MHDPRVRRRRHAPPLALACAALACAALAACADTPPPDPTPAPDRDAAALRMIQLAQAGRPGEARDHVLAYLETAPGDGVMLYNLACLDVMLGETDRALDDLDAALSNGYTNFRLIDGDPSLAPLAADPRFAELVERHESALRDTVAARALTLEEGYPAGPVPLHGEGASAEVELAFDRDALRLTLTATDPDHDASRAPWHGGTGVLVNLVRPISHDDYESRRFHAVALGFEDGEPRAWMAALDGAVLRAPLPDAAPDVERRGDRSIWQIVLPWEVFRPYAPPLDQDMGLNVMYAGAGEAGRRPVRALMPEDRLAWEDAPWRRYVPVAFWTSDRSLPTMRARLYDRLAEYGEVSLEFALWSLSEGPGEYRLSLVDADGVRLADPPPRVFGFDALDGLNFFNESYELGGLANGLYRLELSLDGPDGVPMAFAETFAHVRDGTLDALNERIYRLETAEAQILRYRLFGLVQALDRRHPQEDPTALLVEAARLSNQVAELEGGGTCLPDGGLIRGGFAVDNMTQRLCAVHLPAGWRDLDATRLLLVVPPRPGVELELAAKLGEALSGAGDVVVAVPQSHGDTGLALAPASEQTELALRWARDLAGATDVTLVGLGGGADAALAMSLDAPDLADRVWLEGERLLAEGGRGTPEGLAELLEGRTNEVPYLLAARPNPTGAPVSIAEAMRARGFAVETWGIAYGVGDAGWVVERMGRGD